MTTTLNIEETLLKEVTKLYPNKTKKAIVEMGLRELISANERKELAKLFGKQNQFVELGRDLS
jgi:Arc/MetJ family transcription regulator